MHLPYNFCLYCIFGKYSLHAGGKNYRVEMDHVRRMKDINPKLSYSDKLQIKFSRKQMPLCRPCQMKLHSTKDQSDK